MGNGLRIDIDRETGLTVRKAPGVARAHSKSGDNAKDIDLFLNLVSEAWEDFQNNNSIPTANWVPVKYIRPKELVESPDGPSDVILFKVIKRRRFNNTPDGDRRPRKPELREQIDDPDDDTNTLSIFAQKRENLVEFAIWSTHSKKANQLALQFECFIEAYEWYFTSKGINRVWFEERTEDMVEETGATEWSVRPIRYHVITELIYESTNKKLNTITVRHDSGLKMKTTDIDTETGLVEHSIDRGPSD